MVRNEAPESEKRVRTIKMAVQPARGSIYFRTSMGMLGGTPQYNEELEEYTLASAKETYE